MIPLTRPESEVQPEAPLAASSGGRRWALRAVQLPLAILVVEVLAALFAPWIAPHPPDAINYLAAQAAPGPGHWLGTDDLGRDILSRLIYGGRDSLLIAVASVVMGATAGTIVGLVAGYFRGSTEWVLMRAVDVLLSIPGIVIALVVIAMLGEGLNDLIIAIAVGEIPVFARTVRGAVLTVREREYVEAARAVGARAGRIITRHILPNAIGPIVVLATLDLGVAILNAAGLTYLGLGPPPPTPEWGSMLNEAQNYMPQAWWMAVFPGLAIMVTVLSFNMLGDGLRDILDPKGRDTYPPA